MENVAKNITETKAKTSKKVIATHSAETVTTTVKDAKETKVTKSKLLKLIEDKKFDEVIKLNPHDFMNKDEKSKLNLDVDNDQIKALFHLKDSNFKVDDSVLALALFFDITDVRLAIKKAIFDTAKDKNKDGFYHMFEELTDMENFILIKDGLTRVYNSVMKFKHRKTSIPKGGVAIVLIDGKKHTIDENILKFIKYNLTDKAEIKAMLIENATPINDEAIMEF